MTNTSGLVKFSVQIHSPGQGILPEEQAMDLSGDSFLKRVGRPGFPDGPTILGLSDKAAIL